MFHNHVRSRKVKRFILKWQRAYFPLNPKVDGPMLEQGGPVVIKSDDEFCLSDQTLFLLLSPGRENLMSATDIEPPSILEKYLPQSFFVEIL